MTRKCLSLCAFFIILLPGIMGGCTGSSQKSVYYIFNASQKQSTAESVAIEAVWWIVATKDNIQLLTRRSSLIEPTGGEGYKAYVIALNTALERFSQEIDRGVVEALP